MKNDSTTTHLTVRFSEALAYTADLHRHQRRKGGEIPYVGHLLSVAGLVIEGGGTETQVIAALLHDAVEDQGLANLASPPATTVAAHNHFAEAAFIRVDPATD